MLSFHWERKTQLMNSDWWIMEKKDIHLVTNWTNSIDFRLSNNQNHWALGIKTSNHCQTTFSWSTMMKILLEFRNNDISNFLLEKWNQHEFRTFQLDDRSLPCSQSTCFQSEKNWMNQFTETRRIQRFDFQMKTMFEIKIVKNWPTNRIPFSRFEIID